MVSSQDSLHKESNMLNRSFFDTLVRHPMLTAADETYASTNLRPHERSMKSEDARSKRTKTFMNKQRFQMQKRLHFNNRNKIMESELAAQ